MYVLSFILSFMLTRRMSGNVLQYAYNPTRMKAHLSKCDSYLAFAQSRGINNAFTRLATSKQSQIVVPTLSSAMKDTLDLEFASVCYTQGLPFTLYESNSMKEALCHLNPAYKPPTRHAIAGPLLDQAYTPTKQRVDQLILSLPLLNVVMDESTNISNIRISNISVHTERSMLQWLSEDIGAQQMMSDNVAIWLRSHLQVLSNGDLN